MIPTGESPDQYYRPVRKTGAVILSTLLAVLSASVPAKAEANVFNGASCKKIGAKSTVKGQVFTCTKEKNKLEWRQQAPKAGPAKTPNPSPTTQVLSITPIVSLGKSDQVATPVRATIFLESSSSLPASNYFLVVNAPRGLAQFCLSGGQRTGTSSWYTTGFLSRPALEGRTLVFPIPKFPITMECDLAEASEYKFFVVQAQIINGMDIAKSATTTIALPNYVAPTPKPSPSMSASSKLEISIGQACAPEGASVKASDGQTYLCKKSTTESSLGWIKQG